MTGSAEEADGEKSKLHGGEGKADRVMRTEVFHLNFSPFYQSYSSGGFVRICVKNFGSINNEIYQAQGFAEDRSLENTHMLDFYLVLLFV